MAGMNMPMGGLPPVPTSDPSALGLGGGGFGQGSPLPPPGFDPSMVAPQTPDLAGMIAQALQQAQNVAGALQAAQDATMHPAVQAMMQGPPPGGDPMRGMTGDALTGQPPMFDPSIGGMG